MCCFSPAVQLAVSGTNIFARLDRATRTQYLAYSMSLATPEDVAMVLPLPVARVADDALAFVDLSGAPELFAQLADLFPDDTSHVGRPSGAPRQAARATLVVHRVGSFEASYVPSLGDMDRLDRRFRLPDDVWHALPQYANYGFAVFRLRGGEKQEIHPMAMQFETSEPDALFFPTVHVHSGQVTATARFDHTLYYQLTDGERGEVRAPEARVVVRGLRHARPSPTEAAVPAETRVSTTATRGMVDARARTFRFKLAGQFANEDVRVGVTS